MVKAWSDAAWEDFEYWMRQDKKTLKRILQLLKDIERNGYDGIGKPERLWGFGRDFAPLSEKGRQQAEIAARDIRLKNAELIVSSPYTRALQTAQIISRETGLRVEVDIDLHEWIPDEKIVLSIDNHHYIHYDKCIRR